jgi:hypothetical protein
LNVALSALATTLSTSPGMAGAPPAQAPPAHASPAVHGFPSSQALVLFVKTQPVVGLQPSVVQTLLSLHTVAVPG